MKQVCQFGSMLGRVNHPVTGAALLAPVRISDISDELRPTFIVEPLKFMPVHYVKGRAVIGSPVMGVPA